MKSEGSSKVLNAIEEIYSRAGQLGKGEGFGKCKGISGRV